MKKATLILSIIIASVACFLFPGLDLSGDWTGTLTRSNNENMRLDLSIIQTDGNLSGTWVSGSGASGGATGTVSGKQIRATLSGPWGYAATLNGAVTNSGQKISGSGTDSDGRFTFQLRKIETLLYHP